VDLFGVEIALGTIANLEQEVSATLESAHRKAVEAVRQAEGKFTDETVPPLSPGDLRQGRASWHHMG
jgi:hypothetical protein